MIAAAVNLSDGPLRTLAAQAKEAEGAYIKVGILGGYSARGRGQTGVRRWRGKMWSHAAGNFIGGMTWSSSEGRYLTNVDIGVIHEFGAPKAGIPERSFLRMPILSRLGDEIKTVPLADWQAVLLGGGPIAVLRAIGQAAVNVIQAAFHSGGFGRWAPLKARTIRRKGSSDILVDTTQLRRSISFSVVAPGAPRKALK